MPLKWLEWAKSLRAIAQNGPTYTDKHFDRERYQAGRDIAAEILVAHADVKLEQVHALFSGEMGAATPKVDVRQAVFQNGAILLVKERSDGSFSLDRPFIRSNLSLF